MKNLGILLSGRGSNFEAIAKNVAARKIRDAKIAIVISNRPDAGGLVTARNLALETLVLPSKGKAREDHDREVVEALQQHRVDLVCLAGYMRLLSPWFVKQFPHRILNIHPSLLPAFPGLEAQEQAFAYGVKVAGCTVHFVDEELDHGPIIVQKQWRCTMTMMRARSGLGFSSRNTSRTLKPSSSCYLNALLLRVENFCAPNPRFSPTCSHSL